MPLYEYKCAGCRHSFEILQSLGAGPEGGPSLDLMTTPWRVTASPAEATRAWEGAGIVLLSRWEASPGE